MDKPAVLDCWRFFDGEQFAGKIDYLAIGINPES
jgi:hypothetical protein